MADIQLTPLQHDAITELLNIGMGQAAASLSVMVGEEVKLSIPSVELLPRYIAAEQIEIHSSNRIAAIKQHFNGPFWGDALLLFAEEKSIELVRTIIKEDLSLEMLKELERDALLEIGNIILNSCLASLANVLTHELHSDLPIFISGTANDILKGTKENDLVMFLRMDFSLQTKAVDGYVAFILEIPSIERFIHSIDNYLGVITSA
jgi:chemotaxis protein CheC